MGFLCWTQDPRRLRLKIRKSNVVPNRWNPKKYTGFLHTRLYVLAHIQYIFVVLRAHYFNFNLLSTLCLFCSSPYFAWYTKQPMTLWIHSLSSTGALQECLQTEELVQECSFYKNADKLRSFYKNLLVGDWSILCGREQAFQGPPRTSQRIAARQSLMLKISLQGPRNATCSRVGPTTLKNPRSITWYAHASAKPIGSPVWLLA